MHRFLVTSSPGLEPLLVDELKELNLVWNYKNPAEFRAYMDELHQNIEATAEKMGVKK